MQQRLRAERRTAAFNWSLMQTDFRKRRKGRMCERDKGKEREREKREVSKLEENNKKKPGGRVLVSMILL